MRTEHEIVIQIYCGGGKTILGPTPGDGWNILNYYQFILRDQKEIMKELKCDINYQKIHWGIPRERMSPVFGYFTKGYYRDAKGEETYVMQAVNGTYHALYRVEYTFNKTWGRKAIIIPVKAIDVDYGKWSRFLYLPFKEDKAVINIITKGRSC